MLHPIGGKTLGVARKGAPSRAFLGKVLGISWKDSGCFCNALIFKHGLIQYIGKYICIIYMYVLDQGLGFVQCRGTAERIAGQCTDSALERETEESVVTTCFFRFCCFK